MTYPSAMTAAAASVSQQAHSYLRRVSALEFVNETTMSDDENVQVGTLADDDYGRYSPTPSSSPDEINNNNGEFDPRIFWAVNGFIFCMFLGMTLWCCFGNTDWLTNLHARRQTTDAEYQATLREREERRRQARVVTPDQRRKRLLQSFRRHQVTMEVEEKDIIQDSPYTTSPSKSHSGNATNDAEAGCGNTTVNNTPEDHMSVSSFENKGHLKLPNQTLVPNCCAICLGEYDIGDKVVWSSNKECPHAFHEDCILDWLVKMQPQTPCPCCRQEFTDLEIIRKEKKITWSGGDTFALHHVRF